jgi:hypothetical protein
MAKPVKMRAMEEHTYEEMMQSLQYLIDEGFVVQIGDRYRLKTQEELEQELKDLMDS